MVVVADFLGRLDLRPPDSLNGRVVFAPEAPGFVADNPDAPEALYLVAEDARGGKVSIPAEFVRSVRPAVENAIGQLV